MRVRSLKRRTRMGHSSLFVFWVGVNNSTGSPSASKRCTEPSPCQDSTRISPGGEGGAALQEHRFDPGQLHGLLAAALEGEEPVDHGLVEHVEVADGDHGGIMHSAQVDEVDVAADGGIA